MTEDEYKTLLDISNQVGEKFVGFPVSKFISSPSSNHHVFVISIGDDRIVMGLPRPRVMSHLLNKSEDVISEDKSRKNELDVWISKKELFWKPIVKADAKLPGVIRHIPKEEKEKPTWEAEDTNQNNSPEMPLPSSDKKMSSMDKGMERS